MPLPSRFAVSPDSAIFQPDGDGGDDETGRTFFTVVMSIGGASLVTILGFLFLLYRNAIMRKLTAPCATAHRAYAASRGRATGRGGGNLVSLTAVESPSVVRSGRLTVDSPGGRYAPSSAVPSSQTLARESSASRKLNSNPSLQWASPKRTAPAPL